MKSFSVQLTYFVLFQSFFYLDRILNVRVSLLVFQISNLFPKFFVISQKEWAQFPFLFLLTFSSVSSYASYTKPFSWLLANFLNLMPHFFISYGLVNYSYCNKLLPVWCLKTTEIQNLAFLENFLSLKSVTTCLLQEYMCFHLRPTLIIQDDLN